MGYLHIDNLYKNQDILMFRECYALEKVHGTSAHVSLKDDKVHYFAGGVKHALYLQCFNMDDLEERLRGLGHKEITIFGEAYGGNCQAMSGVYGKQLRFIAFDVRIGETWLDVPNANQVADKLGLEFVPWERVPAIVEVLDQHRDLPSRVAKRRGTLGDKTAEGIVVRPIMELTKSNGSRVIAKHKTTTFQERKTQPEVGDKAQVLADAAAIAEEWVTDMRLEHVLQKLPDAGIANTGEVVHAMQEDVVREAAGEIVLSQEAMKAIGRKAASMFLAKCRQVQ